MKRITPIANMAGDYLLRQAALPMAQTSQVEGRLRAILQKTRKRDMVTRKTMTLATAIAVGMLLPLSALRPVARAEAPAVPAASTGKIDPQVKRLLAQMAAAYQGLQTYSGTEVGTGSEAMGMPYTMDFHYQRPGQMAFAVTRARGGKPETSRLLLDGKGLYVTSSKTPGRYVHQTTPQKNYTLPLDALIIKADVKNPILIDLLDAP